MFAARLLTSASIFIDINKEGAAAWTSIFIDINKEGAAAWTSIFIDINKEGAAAWTFIFIDINKEGATMLHVDATEAIHYDNTLLLFVNDGIIFV